MILNGSYKLNRFILSSIASNRTITIEQTNESYPYLQVDIINKKSNTIKHFYIDRTRFKKLLDKYEIEEDTMGLREKNSWAIDNVRNGINAFAFNNKAIKENVIKRLERWGYKVKCMPIDKPFIIYTIT